MHPLQFYYAGTVIIAAMILGGGTAQGLWTDHLLQILLLPALYFGLTGFGQSRFGPLAQLLVLAILALLLLQFLPVYRTSALPDLLPAAAGWTTWSQSPQKALESALFAITAIGFALFVSRLCNQDQERCLRFVFIGYFVNLIAGIIQLSFDQQASIKAGFFPFDMNSALFANENHFSSLNFIMIPIIAYFNLALERRPVRYLLIVAAIVFFLFAVGSRAGMGISVMLATLSFAWFWPNQSRPAYRAILLILAIVIAPMIMIATSGDQDLGTDLRWVFFSNTWKAITDHWLLGTGLGSFTLVYPAYEAADRIYPVVANHAHNDYLEIVLETGLPGAVLIIAFLCLVAVGLSREKLAQAVSLAIIAICVHSLVDYPLRTMALAVPFALFAGIAFSTRDHPADKQMRQYRSSQSREQPEFVSSPGNGLLEEELSRLDSS